MDKLIAGFMAVLMGAVAIGVALWLISFSLTLGYVMAQRAMGG